MALDWGPANGHRFNWVRDVTFGEDARRIHAGNSPRVLASFANLVITLCQIQGADSIAEARRDCQWNPTRLVTCILTS